MYLIRDALLFVLLLVVVFGGLALFQYYANKMLWCDITGAMILTGAATAALIIAGLIAYVA